MPEIKQEAQVFLIHYQCDECGKGFLQFTGQVKPSVDGKSKVCIHLCSHCKKQKNILNKAYPMQIVEADRNEVLKMVGDN